MRLSNMGVTNFRYQEKESVFSFCLGLRPRHANEKGDSIRMASHNPYETLGYGYRVMVEHRGRQWAGQWRLRVLKAIRDFTQTEVSA